MNKRIKIQQFKQKNNKFMFMNEHCNNQQKNLKLLWGVQE